MKRFVLFLCMFFISTCINAETVRKGDYFAWNFAKDSQAYIDGDFISWRTNDSDDSYEFKQHFIWTDEELTNIMHEKKINFTNDDIADFFYVYKYNMTDAWYMEHNGKIPTNTKQIDISASLYEIYYTCISAKIKTDKCTNLYLKAYENSVKKFNATSSKEYTTYNTYGPLNLPITSLVQQMFDHNKTICKAGKVTPEMILDLARPVKIVETDSIAICSYSEESNKYKCTMNRFYNTSYRCTVSCEGVFSEQEKDLIFDGECSDQWIIPKSRPSLLDIYTSDEFKDIIYDPDKDKKLKKIQKKNSRDY